MEKLVSGKMETLAGGFCQQWPGNSFGNPNSQNNPCFNGFICQFTADLPGGPFNCLLE